MFGIIFSSASSAVPVPSRSTSSSTTQSPANYIIPPRGNNPVLNDPQFYHLLQSQLDSSASISDFSCSSSSTPNSTNSLNSITEFLDNSKRNISSMKQLNRPTIKTKQK